MCFVCAHITSHTSTVSCSMHQKKRESLVNYLHSGGRYIEKFSCRLHRAAHSVATPVHAID